MFAGCLSPSPGIRVCCCSSSKEVLPSSAAAETATGSDEFCRNGQQLVSYSISEIVVQKVTSKGEEHPTPQGVKEGSCRLVPSDMH